MTSTATAYDADFFAGQAAGSLASARRILPIVLDLVSPRAVVDVGCGVGTWLSVAHELGVEKILGVDGPYVDQGQLKIDATAFTTADLESPLDVGRFDLAISLEVAEHLTPQRGPSFVAELTAAAPAVLFSAAIPHQHGSDHRNERWQSDWERDFEANGYVRLDPIRAAVWNLPDVEPWYAQNTMLYVSGDALEANPRLGGSVDLCLPADLVHPRLYTRQHETPPSLGDLARVVPPATARSARRGARRLKRRLIKS